MSSMTAASTEEANLCDGPLVVAASAPSCSPSSSVLHPQASALPRWLSVLAEQARGVGGGGDGGAEDNGSHAKSPTSAGATSGSTGTGAPKLFRLPDPVLQLETASRYSPSSDSLPMTTVGDEGIPVLAPAESWSHVSGLSRLDSCVCSLRERPTWTSVDQERRLQLPPLPPLATLNSATSIAVKLGQRGSESRAHVVSSKL
mmetsp:Transcript_113523/g.327826  ORF Transcript_113523/g.327826 Transcript_113523/m.327826 type:complete len:202 (-) Transcript_113523:354-959(-)